MFQILNFQCTVILLTLNVYILYCCFDVQYVGKKLVLHNNNGEIVLRPTGSKDPLKDAAGIGTYNNTISSCRSV